MEQNQTEQPLLCISQEDANKLIDLLMEIPAKWANPCINHVHRSVKPAQPAPAPEPVIAARVSTEEILKELRPAIHKIGQDRPQPTPNMGKAQPPMGDEAEPAQQC